MNFNKYPILDKQRVYRTDVICEEQAIMSEEMFKHATRHLLSEITKKPEEKKMEQDSTFCTENSSNITEKGFDGVEDVY